MYLCYVCAKLYVMNVENKLLIVIQKLHTHTVRTYNHLLVLISYSSHICQKFSKVSPSFFDKIEPTVAVRRTAIPPRPNVNFNLWSFVKNSVGRDLTKLPMPVSLSLCLSLSLSLSLSLFSLSLSLSVSLSLCLSVSLSVIAINSE